MLKESKGASQPSAVAAAAVAEPVALDTSAFLQGEADLARATGSAKQTVAMPAVIEDACAFEPGCLEYPPELPAVPACVATTGVAQKDASMAVLIQELLSPAYSFVLHTASPMGNDPSTAEFEVAAGLGETLASGKRGSAWRLAVNKSTGAVKTLAFANFSEAMLPAGAGAGSRSSSPSLEFAGAEARSGGLYSRAASVSQSGSRPGSPLASMSGSSGVSSSSNGSSGSLYECSTRVVDYSKQQLSVSTDARVALGRRVGSVAACMERAFGGAQDVEGCLVGEELYVVQTRPQP